MSNTPTKGYLQITKTDLLDGTLIEGIQFDIYQGEGLISTMKTGADGIATSEPLPKGTYTVKEHDLPEGYTGELATMEAVVKSDETTRLTVGNQPVMGQIRIEKSGSSRKVRPSKSNLISAGRASNQIIHTLQPLY